MEIDHSISILPSPISQIHQNRHTHETDDHQVILGTRKYRLSAASFRT